jgi:hypothetical protein
MAFFIRKQMFFRKFFSFFFLDNCKLLNLDNIFLRKKYDLIKIRKVKNLLYFFLLTLNSLLNKLK